MTKIKFSSSLLCAGLVVITSTALTLTMSAQTSAPPSPPQQLAFAGLRTLQAQGQFNAVQSDSSGNLYLLLNQKDGIRLLKTDSTATTVLAQAHLGAAGDVGLAMAIDPTGNIDITGTSNSGILAGTPGTAFPSPADTSTNSFVASFDSALTPHFLTFCGSSRTAASAIAVTADAIFITGSLFSATLPVTPSAILQAPATGSFQNGFAEKFNLTGSALLYATYLTGANGQTAPAAIAADPADNAYIAGYTSAIGLPTLNAIVPEALGPTSGFLLRLTSAADGIVFSTFIPGPGITSLSYDRTAQNLLLSGPVALGQFPVANVSIPLVATIYQVAFRMPLDGSNVLNSTLLAPGTQSIATATPSGGIWVAGNFTAPYTLALSPLATFGNSFGLRLTAQNTIDQAARFGALPNASPAFSSATLNLISLATDALEQPILAGAFSPSASASLLATETFDLPLHNTPTSALPSAVHQAVQPPGLCNGSLCPGSAAYLAKLSTTVAAPSLSLSTDDAPNLTLRNLGSASATSLQLLATGFTLSTNCPPALEPSAECSIALLGSGPGTLSVQSAASPAQTIAIPTLTTTPLPIVFSPKELDFGIQTATSSPATRTLTISNLTQQPQTFLSALATNVATPYIIAEQSSDCPLASSTTKLLGPGSTCHITLSFTAAADPTQDGPVQSLWSIGSRQVLLTAFTQAAALNLSATQINFGTQFTAGLALPRFLYLSNNSTAAVPHTTVSLPPSSPFTLIDRCPTLLAPQSVCQIQINYASPTSPSVDSTTLSLDQGLSVLITGKTLPQPGITGSSVNPNLTVTPNIITFPNAIAVTSTSGASTQTVTIANTGLTAFPLTLALTGDFTQTTNCPTTLPGGSSCYALITFAPAQPGIRQGLLNVTAGATSSPISVALTGTGNSILTSNNGTLSLGSTVIAQPVVQWYKITLPFSQLTAATSGDFSAILVEDLGYGHGQPPTSAFLSTVTGPCTNCWLGLQFTPSAVGNRTAPLSLSSTGNPYQLTLNGTGLSLAGITLTPLSPDFGSIPVNSTSSPILFTLTNLTANPAPITLSAPTTTGDFPLAPTPAGSPTCAGTLSPQASCFFQLTFAPTAVGPRTGSLILQTSAGPIATSLTGFGSTDPGLSLNPTALNFNNLPGPSATLQTITLTNTSSTPLQIATPIATNSSFVPTTTCATLAPSATCTISVQFTPGTANTAATLQIPTTSSNATLTTYTATLSGNYTLQTASLQLLPAQASFGPTPTQTLGLTRQFTINNLTTRQLSLSIALPRQYVLSGPACSGLAPNASCSFNVTFLPLTNADVTGTLFAQANSIDSAATLDALAYLDGFGTGGNLLTVTGNFVPGGPLNFGQVTSGQSSTQTLTLTNRTPNSTPITIRRLTSQWPFLSTSNCTQPLAYNQSCTVTLTYTPLNQLSTTTTSPLPTTDAGNLILESDALTSPNLISLTGDSIPVLVASPNNTAPLLSYTASQNSLTFSATAVGNASAPQTITLSNTGTTTLHLAAPITTPDFTVTSTCSTLVPAASCELAVTFTPQASGTRIAALQLLSDASSSLDFISLFGTATPSLLTLTPNALDFGSVLVAATAQLPLTVANTTSAPITFNAITTTGDYTAAGTCPSSGGTLAPASTCTLQIAFTPIATGTRTGSVALSTSASTLPHTAALTGIGIQSQLTITPSTLNFGSITIGASANLALTLANTGSAPITNLALTLPTSDFSLTTPCPAASLAPGATCTAQLTFTPTTLGTRTATLTIASSATPTPTLIPLSGTGLSNGSFTLTVDAAPTSAVSVISGHAAAYTLTVTPIHNFSGTVVLNCTPITPALFATCSLLPSTIALYGSPQNAIATLNTITTINLVQNRPTRRTTAWSEILLALLCPSLWLVRKRRIDAALWVILFAAATLVNTTACGSGGDPTLRYSPPGNYQYQVTASSTSGIQITQTVTLNLTVQPR